MEENQDTTSYDSKIFGMEADTLAFEGKEACQVNGSKRTDDPTAFEYNGGGIHRNINSEDGLLKNCGSGRLDSPRKSSAAKGEENLQCSPAVESSRIDTKSESSDFGAPQMAISGLFEKDPEFFTDKNVLECESPELTVRDKEVNIHIVKDICIDEGMPSKNKILVKSCKDGQRGADGDINNLFVISNGVEAPALGNTRSVGETEYGQIRVSYDELLAREKRVSYDELLAQCRSKSPSGNLYADDSCKNCEMEYSMQIGETNCVGTENSKKESYLDSKLSIQAFGNPVLKSLDDEGNKAVEQLDEIFSGENCSMIPESAVKKAELEAGTKGDIEPNTVLCDSKIKGGSITFNFNSPEHEVPNITNEQTENLKEELTESVNVHACRDGNTDNIPNSSIAQCLSTKENSIGDTEEQFGDVKNQDTDRSSEGILVQPVSSKDVNNEMAHDGQGIEQHSIKHGRRNSDEASSVASQFRNDEGESSFTAAGLITYSGPIAYSGSLSLRSDGSAASGRSFAFPILQSEWNSSPVRMAKADKRHFRKHKGWRSGLLCCRF